MAKMESRRERYSDGFALTKFTMPVIWQMSSVIPGGFFIYHEDEKRELIYANNKVLDIYGCKTLDEFKELTGYTFQGMVHPDDFESIQTTIDSQIDDEKGDSTDLGASLPSSSSFDVVLCDVPCSGLGLMSGKPDIRHTISYARIKELLPKQQQILSGASSYVKKGGTLVYSTCTLNRDENEKQVEAFLESHPDFYADDLMQYLPSGLILDQDRERSAKGGTITILPDEDGCEGFFVARLKRRT